VTPQELLTSGLIEACVLGAASPEEQREVERLARAHPEVREALEQAMRDIETYAQLHAEKPSEQVRERILAAIAADASSSNVIPLDTRRDRTPFAFTRMAAAASFVLLLGSVAFNIYLYSDLSKTREQAANDDEKIKFITDSLKAGYEALLADLKKKTTGNPGALASFVEPAAILMTSVNTEMPETKAMVYWCSKTRTVGVDPKDLPVAPVDKQYQLWAMVDGKPMSMGVFEAGPVAGVQVLAAVPKAEAFAVTLEKRGGVTAPEGPMYVMAKT